MGFFRDFCGYLPDEREDGIQEFVWLDDIIDEYDLNQYDIEWGYTFGDAVATVMVASDILHNLKLCKQIPLEVINDIETKYFPDGHGEFAIVNG